MLITKITKRKDVFTLIASNGFKQSFLGYDLRTALKAFQMEAIKFNKRKNYDTIPKD